MSAKAAEATTQTFKVASKGVAGEDKGELSISSDRLDTQVRYRLLKQAVVMYQANKRQGTHSTKTRSQVAGSGKKPWKQKGTGHARAGSRKSPIWRGGGVIFGPHPRDYSFSINKKQRRLALRSALFSKFNSEEVQVIEGLDFETPATGKLEAVLAACGLAGKRVLIGTVSRKSGLCLSARNLKKVEVSAVSDFNTLDVLQADCLLLERDAFDLIESGEFQVTAEQSEAIDSEATDSEATDSEATEPEAVAVEEEAVEEAVEEAAEEAVEEAAEEAAVEEVAVEETAVEETAVEEEAVEEAAVEEAAEEAAVEDAAVEDAAVEDADDAGGDNGGEEEE